MEKQAFALVTAAQKLKSYFQAHTIVVLTDKPLRRTMSSPKAAGLMALWAIELSEFDIQYCPQTAIKRQVVADFIAEFTSWKARGQKWFHSGASIQTGPQIGKQEGTAWYSIPQREIRLSALSAWTFLQPVMKQNMKL